MARKANASIDDIIEEATGLLHGGQLAKAEAVLRSVLKGNSDNFDVMRLLGVACHLQKKQEEAEEFLQNATLLDPGSAQTHYNLGLVRYILKRHEEAAESFQKSAQLQPDDADTHGALGGALISLNRFEEAVTSLQRCIEINPDSGETHFKLGIALKAVKRLENAASHFRTSGELEPRNPVPRLYLADIHRELQQYEEAIEGYREVLKDLPENAAAHNSLGIVFGAMRRHDEAAESFQRAIEIDPGFAEAHHNLAMTLRDLSQFDEAISSSRRSLEIKPDYAEAHNLMGNILKNQNQQEEAIESYRKALDFEPDHSNALSQLSQLTRALCDWSNFTEISDKLHDCVTTGKSPVRPFAFLSFSNNANDQLRCAQLFSNDQVGLTARQPVPRRVSAKDKRIRIAYVSADFLEHPVSFQIAELFELHDRDKFEIFGVSMGVDDNSAIRKRLLKSFDRFIDVRDLDDRRAAELIAEQEVHIAVDLTGFTANARPDILAGRPAPVQVNYLGYPGTMGSDFIDYILVDPFIVPPDQQANFSECLVQLPDSFMATDSKAVVGQVVPSRADTGLGEGEFVFCSFNNAYKFTPAIFEIWMSLLSKVPQSVLWLSATSKTGEKNLRNEASRLGVDPARIVFAPRVPARSDHLARLAVADLFLDTLPYNAHATASDALLVGLPVVTCAGNAFAGRVAGSLLHAIGMPELVTGDLEAYEALALKLATDPDYLSEISDKLITNRTSAALFDSKRLCANLESAYSEMFDIWCKGEAPRPFEVSSSASNV